MATLPTPGTGTDSAFSSGGKEGCRSFPRLSAIKPGPVTTCLTGSLIFLVFPLRKEGGARGDVLGWLDTVTSPASSLGSYS